MRPWEHLEQFAVAHPVLGMGGPEHQGGYFEVPYRGPITGSRLRCIASWAEGWDHVSVSLQTRCPRWDEMCRVKDVFFFPFEVAFQLHPGKTEYVNNHPYTLHIWRCQTQDMPMPPREFV